VFERRRISLSSEARKDLRETYDFYESEEVGVGRRFVAIWSRLFKPYLNGRTGFRLCNPAGAAR
jgi:hypothetical protein